jgi:hypothetical protein
MPFLFESIRHVKSYYFTDRYDFTAASIHVPLSEMFEETTL